MSQAKSSLEEKVILRLAREGALTGFAFHQGDKVKVVDGEIRKPFITNNGWLKLSKNLIERGLICEIKKDLYGINQYGVKRDRTRRKKYFWLTAIDGTSEALRLGMKPRVLAGEIRKVYNNALSLAFARICDELPEVVERAVKANVSTASLLNFIDIIDTLSTKEATLFADILLDYADSLKQRKGLRRFIPAVFEALEKRASLAPSLSPSTTIPSSPASQ